jgi:hypothetical protein
VGIANLTFDCHDPERLCRFWAEVLRYEVEQPPPELIEQLVAAGLSEEDLTSRRAARDPTGRGPRLFFQRVPEPKTAKNRVHIDLNAATGRRATREEIDRERDRVVALGATFSHTHDQTLGDLHEYHHVMGDPEGNEFCVQ